MPVDFSEESLVAVALGREFLTNEWHVHLITRLARVARRPNQGLSGIQWTTHVGALNAEQALRDRIRGTAAKKAHVRVEFGDAGREIPDFAQRLHAELIVGPLDWQKRFQPATHHTVRSVSLLHGRQPLAVRRQGPGGLASGERH